MRTVYLFAFLSFFIMSCSTNDDSIDVEEVHNEINPPTWIQGSWKAIDANASTHRFSFTKTNVSRFFTEEGEARTISYAQMIDLYTNSGYKIKVDEEHTDEYYSLSMGFPATEGELNLSFRITESGDLIWINPKDDSDESRIFRK